MNFRLRRYPSALFALLLIGPVPIGAANLRSEETELQIGLARVKITPEEPIWMAGYASRKKPSEGVLTKLYAKAMAFANGQGERGVLLTVDVIGFKAPEVEDVVIAKLREIARKLGRSLPD